MKWSGFSALLILAAALGAAGCGSSKSSGVAITVSPTQASVITNRTQQFSGVVTGSTNAAVTWSLTCQSGVTSCGSIDAAGLYTAPATVPTITSNGTTTVAPTVTIKGTAQADTTKTNTATLTIVTGISITITPTSATVGTTENFTFSAAVSNPGCNSTSNTTCNNVTWSLSTTLTGVGTIGSTTGVYTAPGTVPSPSTVIITATSVADTSVTATATVAVVTAATPTVTSVSPNTSAVGGLFQDIYITGTNFISTNIVYVNHAQLSPTLITQVSSSLIRARIPDFILASPPSGNTLQIGVSKQNGAEQACSGSDQTPCQVSLVNARPGLVGLTPELGAGITAIPPSVPQGQGVLSFGVDGGFFGTGANPASPAITGTFNGQLRAVQVDASESIGSTRHASVIIGGSSNSGDFSLPGLYQVSLQNARDPSKFAVTSLAVQPSYPSFSTITRVGSNLTTNIGTSPSAVAINPRTGIAVVANTGSNDISLIDLTLATPAAFARICTGGASCPATGPTSVAVDDVRNRAVVANSGSNSVAVIDLNTKNVSVIPLQDTPGAVGVNPVTGRALVAMQKKNYGVLIDLTNLSAAPGIVSIGTGTNTKVAVEPKLNWAVVSPGGEGSVGIVDLSSGSSNMITAISRTTDVVTVTVQSGSSFPPLSVVFGEAVQISGVQFPTGTDSSIASLAPTFDGFYTVTGVGPGQNQFSYSQTNGTQTDVGTVSTPQAVSVGTVSYSQPVATATLAINGQGIAVNPETDQAVIVDPTSGGTVAFLSLIDQSVNPLTLTIGSGSSINTEAGTNAAAYNPLTNSAVVVNSLLNTLSVIDPTTPSRLTTFSLTCTTTCGPADVAVDPGTNRAVIANQSDNSVTILNLGTIRPFSVTDFWFTSPDSAPTRTFINSSTLGSGSNPSPGTITVIGTGLNAGCSGITSGLQVRLDGVGLQTFCNAGGPDQGNRLLTATVPASSLLTAHRYALDVFNPANGAVTNAADFAVEQSVDVSTACSLPPEPSGVAIDSENNLAAVSLFGCNALALINMSTGSGSTLGVGSNPIGVAVLPRLHCAVVANNGGSGTASIINYANANGQTSCTPQTVATGSGPVGAAADQATGEVAIANSVANTVTVVNVATGGTSTISTGQRPIAVAFNYINHQVAVAASGSSQLGISAGTTGSASQPFPVNTPTSVVYDPAPADCGSNNPSTGTTTNTTGCFLVAASTGNSVSIVDPIFPLQTTFRVGINPTSIAYNYLTSTLASTNTASHTVTVTDLPNRAARAVLPLPPIATANSNLALTLAFAGALQYAVDVDPLTNVAVIADTANGRVLFVPLPH